jgi:hypothetical protein
MLFLLGSGLRLSPIYTRVKDPLYDLETRQGSFLQPPSRTDQTLSRAHTQNHTPRTFNNNPTVLRLHHRGPPDSRQQVVLELFSPTLFFKRSNHPVSHPSLCLLDSAAKHRVGTSQVSQLLRIARLLTPVLKLQYGYPLARFLGHDVPEQLP